MAGNVILETVVAPCSTCLSLHAMQASAAIMKVLNKMSDRLGAGPYLFGDRYVLFK